AAPKSAACWARRDRTPPPRRWRRLLRWQRLQYAPESEPPCADRTMVTRERGEEKAALAVGCFGVGDFNAKAGQADVGEFRRGQQPDRGNAEVLQDLRAEPDLAPLLGAGRI